MHAINDQSKKQYIVYWYGPKQIIALMLWPAMVWCFYLTNDIITHSLIDLTLFQSCLFYAFLWFMGLSLLRFRHSRPPLLLLDPLVCWWSGRSSSSWFERLLEVLLYWGNMLRFGSMLLISALCSGNSFMLNISSFWMNSFWLKIEN